MRNNKKNARPRIFAVTVTYGNRWHLLEQLLHSLILQTHPVARTIIVSNGSDYDLQGRCGRFKNKLSLQIIGLSQNLGSAGGFKIGLTHAMEHDADLIWLLDDDNRPQADALEKSIIASDLVGPNPDYVFSSFRPSRAKHRAALFYGRSMNLCPVNSFLCFSLMTFLANRLRPFHDAARPTSPAISPISRIEHGIYGGLLISRDWIKRIGYPDERYYLYFDDTEYTTRITKAGGTLYLVADSIVHDSEDQWHHEASGKIAGLFLPGSDLTRFFYSIRNAVFYERQYIISNYFLYLINAIAHLLILSIQGALKARSPRRFVLGLKVIFSAIKHGWTGKMGRAEMIYGSD